MKHFVLFLTLIVTTLSGIAASSNIRVVDGVTYDITRSVKWTRVDTVKMMQYNHEYRIVYKWTIEPETREYILTTGKPIFGKVLFNDGNGIAIKDDYSGDVISYIESPMIARIYADGEHFSGEVEYVGIYRYITVMNAQKTANKFKYISSLKTKITPEKTYWNPIALARNTDKLGVDFKRNPNLPWLYVLTKDESLTITIDNQSIKLPIVDVGTSK